MTDKASRKKTPAIDNKSVERFENEGGAPGGDELARKKRRRDVNQLAKLPRAFGSLGHRACSITPIFKLV